ncbi:uncharacterized protein N0V89_001046 [Didymosphaeria variabile]|uniref:Uncharacterized protein n=1 Tax=Didymosphaeria variabile TaxID=1932322 RepID=A0A9W8XWA6_9PLEO|nr:uncharacterized protein N0V89_001046 [Didymosphaeria variabile]KAJ4360481.1 hypothetical protein N0V89_001046 [Didymosphaeria variabile]
MPRLDTWIKTRVLTLIKPRHHKKLTTKDINISKPIPSSLQHTGWSPVMRSPPQPCSRWSLSAEDLLLGSTYSPSLSSGSSTPSLTHSRESSNSSGITIVVHSPPPSAALPPPNYFPQELPLPTRSHWAEASPVQTSILPASPPMETVLFSETPSPTSYFKSAFEFDIKDLMPADSVLSETDVTDLERMSVFEKKRLTRRMSLGIDGLRPSCWEYNRI